MANTIEQFILAVDLQNKKNPIIKKKYKEKKEKCVT